MEIEIVSIDGKSIILLPKTIDDEIVSQTFVHFIGETISQKVTDVYLVVWRLIE